MYISSFSATRRLSEDTVTNLAFCHHPILNGYVQGSQYDQHGHSGREPDAGPSRWGDEKLHLLHTEEDARRGLRAYFVDIMEACLSHQDFLEADSEVGLGNYNAKYLSKFSDSLIEESLNDDAAANSMAATVLSRYHPLGPEMVFQIFGQNEQAVVYFNNVWRENGADRAPPRCKENSYCALTKLVVGRQEKFLCLNICERHQTPSGSIPPRASRKDRLAHGSKKTGQLQVLAGRWRNLHFATKSPEKKWLLRKLCQCTVTNSLASGS